MDSKIKRNGQSLVEFSLILPILLLLILGIFEGARLIQGYVFAQNASRVAARFAVAGLPANVQGDPWSFDPPIRVEAIKREAVIESTGTGYTQILTQTNIAADTNLNAWESSTLPLANGSIPTRFEHCLLGSNPECAGALGVYVEGQVFENNVARYRPDHPGIEGLNVRVTVYHNVMILDPIYAAITPGGFVRVRADTIMRNEGVDVSISGLEEIVTEDSPPPGSSNTGTSTNPTSTAIQAVDDSLLPISEAAIGSNISFKLSLHPTPGTYNVYFNNGTTDVFVGAVAVDATGTGTTSVFRIPNGTTLGGRLFKSVDSNGAIVAQGTLVVTQSTVGDIEVNGNSSEIWPLGSDLNYQLLNHTANSSATLVITDSNNIRIHTSPLLPIDGTGSSTLDPGTVYTLQPTDPLGLYQFGTEQAYTTIEVVQACIKVDLGTCDQPSPPIIYPENLPIYIDLEDHAANHSYSIELATVNPDDSVGPMVRTIAEITTNGSGQSLDNLYLVPDDLLGDHYLITRDPVNNNVISQKKITLNTPLGPFIVLRGSLANGVYRLPAGTTFDYQLRQHEVGASHDIYWAEKTETNIIDHVDSITDTTNGQGDSQWVAYQIPITTTAGEYHLHSRLQGSVNTLPVSGTTLYPIEVVPQPYITIAGGNSQVPGVVATLQLGNHIANTEYDLYLIDGGNGFKIPGSPVNTNSDGDASLDYLIPTTLIPGQNYTIRSVIKGNTDVTDFVAETTLFLVAPDIIVEQITLPDVPSFNVPIPITITLRNNTPVTITHSSFDVDIYVDPLQAPDLNRALPPGDFKAWLQPPFNMNSTRTITTEIVLYGSYDHEVWARADTSNRIIETSEVNNLLSTTASPPECQIEYDHTNFDVTNVVEYGDSGTGTLTVAGNGSISLTNAGTTSLPLTHNDNDGGYFFVYQQMTSDFTVRVRLESQSTGGISLDDFANFGLEVRSSLAPDADKIQWVRTKSERLSYTKRDFNLGDPSERVIDLGPNNMPIWLQIVKQGDEFTLSYSVANLAGTLPPPNVSWTPAATLFMPNLSGNVYLGLMNDPQRTSGNNQPNTVSFSNYHVCGNVGGLCGPVRESNGLIILDANNYIFNQPDVNHIDNVDERIWAGVTNGSLNGVSVANNGNTQTGSNYSIDAARLDYEVDVTNAGTYYVWFLGSKPDSSGNSIHFSLSSAPRPENQYYTMGDSNNTVRWFNTTNSGSNTIDLALGTNDLSMWMREDGFEIFQILLTQDSGFSPSSNAAFNQSQCSVLGVPPAPPGLQQCQAAIVNGDFEDDGLMSEWHYSSIGQSVARTSVPHYFGPNQSFSMVLPDTTIGGIPRSPWLWQEFMMPSWIITPTLNGGASIKLSMHVGVNPEGNPEPDELFASLRDTTGTFSVTKQITAATGADTPALVPPISNNSKWLLKQVDLALGFDPPESILSYRNQNLRLYLEAPNTTLTDSTRFYIDNVDLQVCNIEPRPGSFNSLVSGQVKVLLSNSGSIVSRPGIFVWIYAIDGSMEKTYSIQDSTFSFYDLPVAPGGTEYLIYAEYEENGEFYGASTNIRLTPQQPTITNLALLLF